MAKQDKRIEALRRNPENVRPDDLDVVLRGAGFTSRQHGGSHKTYTRGATRLTVPQRKPFLKAVYVKLALDLIDDAEEN